MAARILLGGLALVVAAVLAVQLRAEQRRTQAESYVFASRTLSTAEVRRTEHLLDDAGRFTPDSRPEVLRGILLIRQGRHAEAIRVLEPVAADEPDNIEPWAWLAQEATEVGDRALAAHARARQRAISPAVPAP